MTPAASFFLNANSSSFHVSVPVRYGSDLNKRVSRTRLMRCLMADLSLFVSVAKDIHAYE